LEAYGRSSVATVRWQGWWRGPQYCAEEGCIREVGVAATITTVG